MRYLPILFLVALLCQTKGYSHDGVIITGHIKNVKGDFIILSHVPRLRGNLNYDGFVSIGAKISEEGHFKLTSKTIVHGGLFLLEFADTGLGIELLSGDSIHLEFDLEDMRQSLFATGRGAGKFNLLQLEEFQYRPFEDKEDIEHIKAELNHRRTTQLALLDAIHKGEVNSPMVVSSNNRAAIERIIKKTPLSREEWKFLQEQMLIRSFSIASFLKADAESLGLDSLTDISPYLAEVFKEQNYELVQNMNHPYVAGSLDEIVDVEFARMNLSNDAQISHRDFVRARPYPQYYQWIHNHIRNNFSQDIFEKWFADQIGMMMTMGRDYEEEYERFSKQCSLTKYQDRLARFHNLLTTGLQDPIYQLDNPDLTLDKGKFDHLLKSYQGKLVYIVFWSAEFAGSSIINHLPLLKNLEDIHDHQLSVLHICIDRQENKPLWAARIIDNHWQGAHYFMPIEENEQTLVDFGSQRIASFCYGGATYSFVSPNGEIHKNVEPPMKLEKYIIEKLLE